MAYRSFGSFRQASTHLDTPAFTEPSPSFGHSSAREELGRILGITHRGGSIIVGLVEWGISLSIHQLMCSPVPPTPRQMEPATPRRDPRPRRAGCGAPAAYFDRSDDDRLVAVAL